MKIVSEGWTDAVVWKCEPGALTQGLVFVCLHTCILVPVGSDPLLDLLLYSHSAVLAKKPNVGSVVNVCDTGSPLCKAGEEVVYAKSAGTDFENEGEQPDG